MPKPHTVSHTRAVDKQQPDELSYPLLATVEAVPYALELVVNVKP